MGAAAAATGLVLVGLVLWEVFQDLFHPADSGALSDWIGRTLFAAVRGSRFFPLAGPVALTDLAALLSDRFVEADLADRDAVFEAFATDHHVARA